MFDCKDAFLILIIHLITFETLHQPDLVVVLLIWLTCKLLWLCTDKVRLYTDRVWLFTDKVSLYTDKSWLYTDKVWLFIVKVWLFTVKVWLYTDKVWLYTDKVRSLYSTTDQFIYVKKVGFSLESLLGRNVWLCDWNIVDTGITLNKRNKTQ